jgi:hypothetical protein
MINTKKINDKQMALLEDGVSSESGPTGRSDLKSSPRSKAAGVTADARRYRMSCCGRDWLTIGSIGFPTGQALLDWLRAANQPFNISKVIQKPL